MEIDIAPPFKPRIKQLLDFGETFGLVEEKENFALLSLSTMNKINCGVESLSGSGKSILTDITMKLFNPERVFNIQLTSNTAVTYQWKDLETKDIIYIEELQKAINASNPILVEVLKNITEGKPITRVVRNQITNTNEKQVIKGDLSIIYSLALENKVKKDDELDRRVITFTTDISQEQTRRVVKYLGKTRFNRKRLKVQTDEVTENLKRHVDSVLNLCKSRVENPFAEYISDKVPVPFVKVRSYITHYFNLIDSSTKFHYKERMKKGDSFFTSIQDIYIIHKLYGRMFNQKIHNLPQLGIEIMETFDKDTLMKKGFKKNVEKALQSYYQKSGDEDENRYYLELNDIHSILKIRGILVKHKIVQNQCDELVEAGFLGRELSGKKALYYKTDEVEEFEDNFDFQKCFFAGYDNMKANYPLYVDEWLSMQLDEKNGILLYDPVTGEERYLTDLIPPKIREKPMFEKDVIHHEEEMVAE